MDWDLNPACGKIYCFSFFDLKILIDLENFVKRQTNNFGPPTVAGAFESSRWTATPIGCMLNNTCFRHCIHED